MADTLMRNQRRRTLTDKMVAALPKKQKRYTKPDPEQGGHYVRVMPDGANVFVAVARDPHGKQVWHTIGSADVLQIAEARERARTAIRRIKDGLPPVEAPPVKPDSVKAVAESWLQRHVAKKKLRTEDEIKRCLNKYVYDQWADHNFINIKRSDITTLLDHIEDDHGSRQADLVLAILRSIANWFASRDDSYVSPFTRGMRRHERGARTRILTDDELRAVWKQGEQNAAFGAIVRLALLTAQRREKIRTMKWSDVSIDGKWTIAADEREKGNAGTLVLPPQALSIITIQPRLADNPYVFAGRGNGCFDVSQSKPRFDKGCGVTGWTLHDCRRTARSLMSRAGVRPDVSERVMGHTIPGVAGVYDRHAYIDEKADALRRLAGLIETILKPPKGNVRQLREAKR